MDILQTKVGSFVEVSTIDNSDDDSHTGCGRRFDILSEVQANQGAAR